MRLKTVIKIIAAAAGVGIIIYLLLEYPVAEKLLEFSAWIDSQGWWGIVVFTLVFALGVLLFLPSSVMSLGAGFAYGIALGTGLVMIAATAGATLAFLLARYIAQGWITRWMAKDRRFHQVDQAIALNGFKFVLLTRLSPFIPYVLQNYAYGLTSVTLKDYCTATILGIIPGTLLYVYLGSMITEVSQVASGEIWAKPVHIAFYILGLAATIVITVALSKMAKQAMMEEKNAGIVDQDS